MSASPLLLHFDDEAGLARQIADALGWPCQEVLAHRFPDGEWKLRHPRTLASQVVLLRGLHAPNEKLAQLLLLAPALRHAGVEHLSLIAPYLAYMRQDMAFEPGEVVSQRHLGHWLAQSFDAVLTLDPHLHRVATLAEVLPGCQALALSAAPAIGAFVAERLPRALLLGPDEEAAQWVHVAAQGPGLDHAVCRKCRRGDREVEVALPQGIELRGRQVVLVDDVASTGRTLVEATRAALAAGAASVDVAVTHALFVGDAMAQLRAAGAGSIWSTDCVPHASNAIACAPLIAAALASRVSPGPDPSPA